MLSKIYIRSYAIIDEISISFSPKMNIITGETGAGKSILVGALGLVLGDRFESAALQQGNEKCIVEATFSISNYPAVDDFITSNQLDSSDELVVRREVSANGKSRSFINDTPVNLSQLKQLGALVADLHQQFDTLELGSNDFQRQVLDALAGNGGLLQQYQSMFSEYFSLKKELEELKEKQKTSDTALDYHRFLYSELADAAFREDELEQLEAELKVLDNAENIKQQLSDASFALLESEQPLVQQLKIIAGKLDAVSAFHPRLPEVAKRLEAALLELKDVAEEIEHIGNSVQYDPERIQQVNERIALGYKLLKKHNVNSTAGLLSIKEELERKLDDVMNLGETISQKEKQLMQLQQSCEKLAGEIAANRQKIAAPFSKQVDALLKKVGMPNARIKVQLNKTGLNHFGNDEIEFLFNANVAGGKEEGNEKFEPLRKVASGGELSRLMLCIKSLVVKELKLPVLIFDEIDSGISGEAAKQVGAIMKSLSSSLQLIAITHQPQIAARADAHYFVHKAVKGNRISTSIRQLDSNERIEAVAKMLSGEKPTAAAIENAREMVEG